ncbi:nucleoside hydrolase [Asaia bogorensis]|uniref:Nucleoside hydrolase n=1 Tax=Asaia bogorensis NBRC 16594 TaxID=1231624 RepID=A0AAN4R136_9PROT|nr:nucleoside hydrolase [Asaia bogorensis]BAT20328.1 nucleoside hydrolase [Asaia bogorensis NBRC 16594]GBQ79690.1 nucleoside hydrolase [Asaia bogorensis NBRC 16594]GEL52250.1 nucleoside hydrolase [Asaia bogorensis NBRC 16594]
MRCFLASLALAALTIGTASAETRNGPELVIADNDYLGPGGSNIQSVIPLLNNPKLKVLGLTVVAGDDWENAESARIRRFLEISGHRDVPVYDGATQPLINTVALTRLREQQYGSLPWKGAWGGMGSMDKTPDTQPAVAPTPDGKPELQPQGIPAALFMIQQVHAHPHEVTIIEAGPMTNLALAIRLDPSFASTAKQLVFMGGYLDLAMMSVTGNADNGSDFNLIFDPEAAHITLTAPWAHITSVANVSNDVVLSKAEVEAIARDHRSAATDYLVRYYVPLAMWDEVTSAIVADPSLVTKKQDAYMDVEIGKGIGYGHAYVWPDALAPKAMGVRKVSIVQAIDVDRFKKLYAGWAQGFMGKH